MAPQFLGAASLSLLYLFMEFRYDELSCLHIPSPPLSS